MFSRIGESGHPCLVLGLRERVFDLSLLNMMLAVGLSYMAFIMLGYIPSIPHLLRVFIIKRMLNFVNAFL